VSFVVGYLKFNEGDFTEKQNEGVCKTDLGSYFEINIKPVPFLPLSV
jgi:hypothetical protein